LRGLNYGDYSYIEEFPDGGELNMPPVNVPRRIQLFEIWIRTLRERRADADHLSDAEAGRDSRGRSLHRSSAVEARRSVRTLATQRIQSPDHSFT
jgi:hypothetical protein